MKTNMVIAVTALGLIGLTSGCKKESTSSEKSQTTQVIEGVTGKTAVDSGRPAAETIRNVAEKEQNQINEVLD